MNQTELQSFRQRLTRLRDRLRGDVAQLADEALRAAGGEASGNLSNTPYHLADLGTDNFEEEMTLGLLENQEQVLEDIRAALARVDDGTYGRCQECGGDIGRERLQTLPHTSYCIACARRLQAGDTPGKIEDEL
jgi:RNA polymerase-binding protein DksA